MNRTLGDYELLEELGAGGMGTVYRARHASTGVEYALKTLRAGADPELVARFQREGEGQARVDDHPNVVRVRSLARDGATAYLVMDLVTGGSLDARLRRGLPTPERAAGWVRDLALAVAHAHRQGVLHRDLKPQNVLFDGETPQLTDFGLAKLLDAQSLTETGSLLGTPAYMAPEQVRGQTEAIGPATDVYGLGALLYHCLTGSPPFQGGQLAVLRQVLETPPATPGSRRPGLAPALEAVCLRALAKDPLERYPSANALADALEALLTAAPAHRPGLAATVALALTLVVALGGLAAAVQPRSQAPAAASPTTPAPTPPRSPAATPTEAAVGDPAAAARRRPCAGLHEYDVAGIRRLNLDGRFAEARQEVLRVLSGPPCEEQIYALAELGWAIAFDAEPDLSLAEGYMLHAASQGHARACWMLGSLWSTPELRPSIYDAPTFHPDRRRAAAAIWLAHHWASTDEHSRALGYFVEQRALLPSTEAEARALVLPAELPPLSLPLLAVPEAPAVLWTQPPDDKAAREFAPVEALRLDRLAPELLERVESQLRLVLVSIPSRLHPQAYRLGSQAELLRRGDTPRMRLLLLRAALLGDAEAASTAFAAYYPWPADSPLRSTLTLGEELDVALAWLSLACAWADTPTHRANLKVALATVHSAGHELPNPAQAYTTVWEQFPEAR